MIIHENKAHYSFLTAYDRRCRTDQCLAGKPTHMYLGEHIRSRSRFPTAFPLQCTISRTILLTEEGFALGNKLFHDHILSKNSDVTCSSCHQSHAGYTTFDHDLGHGTNHQHTARNVPVIFNMVWQKEFEWDGTTANLTDQPLACMTAPEKMGEQVNTVIQKLDTSATYKQMFGAAFGDESITGDRIAKALTQFVASLVSAGSKYDLVKKGLGTFNASEQSGYDLFQEKKCNNCHTEPLFTDLSYRNVGLDLDPFHLDFGRMRVTPRSGRFTEIQSAHPEECAAHRLLHARWKVGSDLRNAGPLFRRR